MAPPQGNRLTRAALLALVALALFAPWIPFGEHETVEAERADLQKYFADRERELAAAEQRHDWAFLDKRLAANFQEIGADGRVYSKQQIAELFPAVELLDYKLSDMQVEPVAVNVILVTYTGEFEMRTQGKVGPFRARLSTLWVRDSNYEYKARLHQVVALPAQAASK